MPSLEWITPAVSSRVVTDPSSTATILGKRLTAVDLARKVATNEVEVVRRGVNELETPLRDRGGVGG